MVRYAGGVSTQNTLKLLFELRAVLDRLGENDSTIEEAIVHDVERAMRLTDACIAQLAQEEATNVETGPETGNADEV